MDQDHRDPKDGSKRSFLKQCGLALLTTASYTVVAVLGNPSRSEAGLCDAGCEDACVDSCTGCTTVPCFTVPDPPPPTPVPDPAPPEPAPGGTSTPEPAPGGTAD